MLLRLPLDICSCIRSISRIYITLQQYCSLNALSLSLRLRTGSLQNEPLFLRTYTDAEGEEEEDANLRLHNIVHSSLDVVGERKGMRWVCKQASRS